MNNKKICSDYINSFSEVRMSEDGRENILKQFNAYTKQHSASDFEKLITQKYFLLCDELHKRYNRGCKIIRICKIIAAALFAAFSIAAVFFGNQSGYKMLWLSVWILFIFINVGIFIIADYCKNLMSEKVISYLDNIEQIDFGIDEEYEAEAEDNEDDF